MVPSRERKTVMIKRTLDTIELAIKVICRVLIGVIVAVLFYAVVMRYVFHYPPSWSIEVGRYLFIWMVILSAALVTREQSHVQITFLVNLLPKRLRFLWLTFIRVLMMGFCWLMIQQGLVIYPIVASAASPCLGISMGWWYLSIPVGGLLMGVYILETIVKSIIDHVKMNSSEEKCIC